MMNEPMPQAGDPLHYDRITILLHWLTALLVVTLFALAEIWDFLPHDAPLRKNLEELHVSFGLLLTAVLLLRLGWRVTFGRHLLAAATGLQGLAAKAMHIALYILLTVQVGLGFWFRWAQAETFTFFGLFSIPSIMEKNRDLAHTLGDLHDTVAWTIIILAGLHAAAALAHHFVWKDGVLARMLPGLARR
jgi:cytochrome b561